MFLVPGARQAVIEFQGRAAGAPRDGNRIHYSDFKNFISQTAPGATFYKKSRKMQALENSEAPRDFWEVIV